MKITVALVIVLSAIASLHASDTLRPVSFADTCARKFVPNVGVVPDLVIYVYTPQGGFGGYICGNNDLNIPVKAQKYYFPHTGRASSMFSRKASKP